MPKTTPIPIITLLTDYGQGDHAVAVLKGALLQQHSSLHIIDISHQIQPHDIVQAAYIFKNAFRSFPKGTIHILSINNYSANQLRFIGIRHAGHIFLGPDNGIFSLIFENTPKEIVELGVLEDVLFSQEAIFSHAVGHLVAGKPFMELGLPVTEITERLSLQPVISTVLMRGSVIFIDKFENVVINIKKDLFEKVSNNRNFALYFKRNDPITSLSEYYYDVPVGETLCFFNASDYLEIAINMGKAASMLGLNLEDTVEVRFM